MSRQTAFLFVCLLPLPLVFLACTPTIAQQPTLTAIPAPPTPTFAPPPPSLSPTLVPSHPTTATLKFSDTWSSPSPDGKWTARGSMTDPFPADDGSEKYQTKLEVINAAGAVQWTLVDQTLNYGLGYTTPRPFHWSEDGRYLYFTNLAVPDGCAVFTNGSDLYRADLTNGQVTEIVPSWVSWVSLSPDEQRVAYLRWNGQALELAVREIATGEERKTGLEARYTQAGNILWSPDGQALMLTLAANPCDPANWVQSIARVDLAALSSTSLIRDDKRLLTTTEWSEANKVLLTDKDGNLWTMEATTGKLTRGDK